MVGDLRTNDVVCLWQKSIYGLCQAGRNCFEKFDAILKGFGATPTNADPLCIPWNKGKTYFVYRRLSRRYINNFEKIVTKSISSRDFFHQNSN